MKSSIMNFACSEYNMAPSGKTYFFTFAEARDVFSTWVRDNYHIINNLQLAINLLKNAPGPFVDVGANIGTFAIPLIKSTSCRSTLVEALPENCLLLKAALGINDINNAVVVNVATLDRDGITHMAGDSAYGRVSDEINLPAVSCKKLDTLSDEYDMNDIALIKIDVEGSELKTLHGASRFFQRNPNVNVIIESNGGQCHANGYRPANLMHYLEQLGYDIYAIFKQSLVRQTSERFQPFGIIDYLATKQPVDTLPFPEAQLSREQIVRSVIEALTNQNRAYRDYMMDELRNAPADIQDDIAINKALSRLINTGMAP